MKNKITNKLIRANFSKSYLIEMEQVRDHTLPSTPDLGQPTPPSTLDLGRHSQAFSSRIYDREDPEE